FVFQAEDGIRDFHVTGVQTCALPICAAFLGLVDARDGVSFGLSLNPLDMVANANVTVPMFEAGAAQHLDSAARHGRGRGVGLARSEERRVGKEDRSQVVEGEQSSTPS